MAAPFACDEQVSIERLVTTKDPRYGTQIQTWVTLHDHFWANVQDVLPSRAEATGNGLAIGTRRARLRIRDAAGTDMTMRAVLHSRGGQVMQIVAGPARIEGTDYDEFMLEAYSSDHPST
jgi:head-tail adaptor